MRSYDKYGNEQSLDWLHREFGPVEVLNPVGAPPLFEVAELHEVDDLDGAPAVARSGDRPQQETGDRPQRGGWPHAPTATICAVRDEKGQPLPGIDVVFWYSSAPELPGAGWWEQGDVGTTKLENGCADFAMGGGAYYDPAHTKGPHDLWIYGEGASQIISGLGMIAGTNHRHLDVVFQRVDPNMPPYDDPDLPRAVRAICEAQALEKTTRRSLDAIRRRLQDALDALARSCYQ